MIVYTLILTMALRIDGPAAAIHTDPGYATLESCQAAGNAWIAQQNRTIARDFYRHSFNAICVRKEVK